jgi:hypothetical protein
MQHVYKGIYYFSEVGGHGYQDFQLVRVSSLSYCESCLIVGLLEICVNLSEFHAFF